MGIGTLISAGCLIGGLWSVIAFVSQYIRDRRRSFDCVIGTVVYIETQHGSSGRNIYTPVYQYEFGGQVYQNVHHDSTMLRVIHQGLRGPAFVVGSTIPLLVDRNDPAYAMVNDYSRYMMLWQGLGLLLIGLFCF